MLLPLVVFGSLAACAGVDAQFRPSSGPSRFGFEGLERRDRRSLRVYPRVATRHFQLEIDGLISEDLWLTEDLGIMGAMDFPVPVGSQVRVIADGRSTPVVVVGQRVLHVIPLFGAGASTPDRIGVVEGELRSGDDWALTTR